VEVSNAAVLSRTRPAVVESRDEAAMGSLMMTNAILVYYILCNNMS